MCQYVINEVIWFSEYTFAPMDGTHIILPLSFDYLLFDILCDDRHYHKLNQYIYDSSAYNCSFCKDIACVYSDD